MSTCRASAIIYMRRANLSWELIMKITGHKRIDNLIKHYDTMLEAQGTRSTPPSLAHLAHP